MHSTANHFRNRTSRAIGGVVRLLEVVRLGGALGFLCLVLAVSSSSAQAGLVTSQDTASIEAASLAASHSLPVSQPRNALDLLHQADEQSVGLQSTVPSGSSTGSPAGNSFSSSHPLAALASTSCLPALAAAGWVTPESVLALPSVPPSGLFRPPCCNHI